MDNDFRIDNRLRGFCARGCGRQDKQLNTYDYLADIPGNTEGTDLVEVQFKNTRKGYYHNDNRLPLEKGDMVAVEASPGHDIGVVSLTGQLVPLQMKKANLKAGTEIKRVYRKARPADLEKYEEAKSREQETMIRSRQIAKELELNMKIGDVEYQGDGNKAIFYYIADARVDFRKLIKVLAEAFHVRIEMKQIGARQEAGRIGGIGPCGRELCCASWMKNFNSVSTAAARFQDISPNPQKLAGQCAKLKCCLNYEVDTYVEAFKKLPSREVQLETADNTYYVFKVDILAGTVTYSTDKRMAANLVTIPRQERSRSYASTNRAKSPHPQRRKQRGSRTAHRLGGTGGADTLRQEQTPQIRQAQANAYRRKPRNPGPRQRTAGTPAQQHEPATRATERRKREGRQTVQIKKRDNDEENKAFPARSLHSDTVFGLRPAAGRM